MERYRRAGVDNLLALHGDPPLSATDALPGGAPRYAVELVRLARELGFPGVGVALHPEGHPAAPSREADWQHQAAKLREADFGLTQFFHRAEDYFALVDEMRARGAEAPVLPGVMPITNVRQVERMAAMSGASMPQELAEKLLAVADRPDEVRRAHGAQAAPCGQFASPRPAGGRARARLPSPRAASFPDGPRRATAPGRAAAGSQTGR